MNKTNLSILVGLVSAFALILGVSAVYPSVDDLWVENPFWNGLSELYSAYQPHRLKDYNELDALLYPENSTLFIIGPYIEFIDSEVISLKIYLAKGGTVVLMDDTGTGNQLLEAMGLRTRFSSGVLLDPVFRERNIHMPRALTLDIPDVDSLVLNYATSLNDIDDRYVLVWSSTTSYLSDSKGEPMGIHSQPVLARIPQFNGWIFLVSDSSLFINSMIDRADNAALLNWLASDEVIIDEAHGTTSSLGGVKSMLAKTYTLLGFYEIRYTLTGLVTLGILRIKLNVTVKPVDPVEELMKKHPEYNRHTLEWLQEQRRTTYGS